MTFRVSAAALAALFWCSPASAQAAPDVGCELHVWPAKGLGAVQWTFAGEKADERARVKEAHLASIGGRDSGVLPPTAQLASLSSIGLDRLLGLNGYRTVIHEEPLDSRTLRTVRGRFAPSATACYAELVVSDNQYASDWVTGRNLLSLIRFRTFGPAAEPIRRYSTWVKHPLVRFSLSVGEPDEAAQKDLRDTFETNLASFAELLAKSDMKRQGKK